MSEIAWARAVLLLVPLTVTGLLWMWRGPSRLHSGGALLTQVWNLPWVFLVLWLGVHAGWWSFHAEGGLFVGVPVDLWLAEMMLWGTIPLLLAPRRSLALVAGLALAADVGWTFLAAPVVEMHPGWWWGKLLGLAVAFFPAQLLGRWTLEGRRLFARGTFEVIAVSGLILLLATLALEELGKTWWVVAENPWWYQLLVMPALAYFVGLGWIAVHEIITRGRGGTPVPWDPPRRLMATGPYSFVANPMHVSLFLLFAGLALWLRSPWVVLLAVWTFFHGHLFVIWDGPEELSDRHGAEEVQRWKAHVRPWLLRWRPWLAEPSTVRISGRGLLPRLARGLVARGVTSLEVEDGGTQEPGRVVYRFPDSGFELEGVLALTRITDHLSLPWAWTGWLVRLPLARPVLELLFEPRGKGAPVTRAEAS